MTTKYNLLIVEDDEFICEEYKRKIKEYQGLQLIDMTNNTATALQLIEEYKPDALIIDLELHKGYGNGLLLLQELDKLELPSRPFCVVVTNNISQTTHNAARNLGADFVITKNQQDFSVNMVFGFLSSILGVTPEPKSSMHKKKKIVDDERSTMIQKKISAELDLIGVSPKVLGRKYLSDAIEIVINQRVPNISVLLADKYHKSNASIERAMENAVNRTWKNTDIDTLTKHYTAYIKPERGEPTVTEFIYYYANKVKATL